MASKAKTITVKPYSYRKNGKKVSVKGHKKTIKTDTVTVTKKEYAAKAAKRSAASLERDKSRTKRGAIKGNKANLPKSWNTKNQDWVGIDANGYPNIPKKHSTLKGGIKDYSIIKWITKRGASKYQCRYKGKPIGQTTPYSSLTAAKKACKTHHGRLTGKIKNTKTDALHAKILNSSHAQNPYRIKDDPNVEFDAYDDSYAYQDSSLSHHENLGLQKSRFSFREQSMYW